MHFFKICKRYKQYACINHHDICPGAWQTGLRRQPRDIAQRSLSSERALDRGEPARMAHLLPRRRRRLHGHGRPPTDPEGENQRQDATVVVLDAGARVPPTLPAQLITWTKSE